MKKSHRTFYLGYLFAITCNAFGQAASTDDIVQKLLTESSQEKIVREAVTRFNPDTVEVLFERFSKVSDVDRRKQLAFDFLLGGVPDNRYFDLLQSWARTAVNDQAPTIYVYDAQGEAIRGTVSADFQNWCFDANLKLSDCSKTRLLDYYLDVIHLVIVGDPRSEEIFWKGLKSSNIGVAFLGASGLGILGKTNAIEKIEACASTLPAGAARLLAVSFLEFSDARAYAAFAKYYPDPKMREGMRDILSVGRIRASMRAK